MKQNDFTETQIKPSESTRKIIESLNFLDINFNNNEKKVLGLAYGCRNDVNLVNKFDANGIYI